MHTRRTLRFPPVPVHKTKQRYANRFWGTDTVVELLALHYGCNAKANPKSWQYRMLIAVHRDVHSTSAYRLGYGPDWKGEIKPDLLEYGKQGRLPGPALAFATPHVRDMERQAYKEARAKGILARVVEAIPLCS